MIDGRAMGILGESPDVRPARPRLTRTDALTLYTLYSVFFLLIIFSCLSSSKPSGSVATDIPTFSLVFAFAQDRATPRAFGATT